MHPDIQFAPLVPPLASIFLHFMEENLCYACISALVNSRRSMLDQSQRAFAVMAKTFQDSLKSYFVSQNSNMHKYTPHYFNRVFKYFVTGICDVVKVIYSHVCVVCFILSNHRCRLINRSRNSFRQPNKNRYLRILFLFLIG